MQFQYKVGFLGIPDSSAVHVDVPGGEDSDSVGLYSLARDVPWNRETISALKAFGFNVIQVNLAWGTRPGDDPLNLEDLVGLPQRFADEHPQVVPLRCRCGAEALERRCATIKKRIQLVKQAGMKTLFHFGAPYNAHARYGDAPPNCISEEATLRRYELLIDALAKSNYNIDDLLIYTYDQDAWLCNEFGPCSRCSGVPLHKRLVPFLERISSRWLLHNPEGRVWWEPWELSAGQSIECIQRIAPNGFGLCIHSNIGEVMASYPVDRWFRNICRVADERGIPVIGEHWLGACSEEVEPFYNLPFPGLTYKAVSEIAEVRGIRGIKEYFGLNTLEEDAQLRMSSILFQHPLISEDEAMAICAEPYGSASSDIIELWKKVEYGMTLFPWEASWYFRQIGRSRTDHSLSAAIIRGKVAHTPSWESSRNGIFMCTNDGKQDPWMIEDIQLRCGQAARIWEKAIAKAEALLPSIPSQSAKAISRTISDLKQLMYRARTYKYHLRETNICSVLRDAALNKKKKTELLLAELTENLKNDLNNHSRAVNSVWKEMEDAIKLLSHDADAFLRKYFLPAPDRASRGLFSATSC